MTFEPREIARPVKSYLGSVGAEEIPRFGAGMEDPEKFDYAVGTEASQRSSTQKRPRS